MTRPKSIFKKRKGGFNYRYKKLTENVTSSVTQNLPTPSVACEPKKISASKQKMCRNLEQYNERVSNLEYIIVNKNELFDTLQEVAVCKICNNTLSFENEHISGLASKIQISCSSCKVRREMYSCNRVNVEEENGKPKPIYGINLRLVYALRTIGKGHTAAKMLCGILNLPPPPDRYSSHEIYLGTVVEQICKSVMKNAVEEVVMKTQSRDLCVAVDGTWQKRGHTSLNGVLSVSSLETGKVLDVSIMSKHCLCPNKLTDDHEESF